MRGRQSGAKVSLMKGATLIGPSRPIETSPEPVRAVIERVLDALLASPSMERSPEPVDAVIR